METRCDRGAEIARKMRFSESVVAAIRNFDEHWDGGGMPNGLRGEQIPVYSRIALMAQIVDVFQMANGIEAAKREVENRTETWFDPQLSAAFERVAAKPEFWDTLRSDDLQMAIFALEPAQERSFVDDDYLDDIAAAFAQVIDSKSPYTSGHSERVTLFSDLIAKQLELSAERRRWLRRAALLHDIGKLGVSNSVLDKPAKLDPDEWAAMQKHAVADIFDALTADRPYRAAMPVEKAFAIMADMVNTAIDATCFAALKSALKQVDASLAA
jgi:HD-GYP domain-containing protein (c-di-GMP phosphodiesterase class II)